MSFAMRQSALPSCKGCCSIVIRWRARISDHSHTKDIAGSGATTAGVCIGRNERMFIPKGQSVEAAAPNGTKRRWNWDETLFWNVYYVKEPSSTPTRHSRS